MKLGRDGDGLRHISNTSNIYTTRTSITSSAWHAITSKMITCGRRLERRRALDGRANRVAHFQLRKTRIACVRHLHCVRYLVSGAGDQVNAHGEGGIQHWWSVDEVSWFVEVRVG